MQFKEGNLQFTEELKFTDDYGRFSKAEMPNFSDPGKYGKQKAGSKEFCTRKMHTHKERAGFQRKRCRYMDGK